MTSHDRDCVAGVRVALRVTPGAAADRVRGVVRDAAGVAALQVAVTAVPEDGRANAAVAEALARDIPGLASAR